MLDRWVPGSLSQPTNAVAQLVVVQPSNNRVTIDRLSLFGIVSPSLGMGTAWIIVKMKRRL